LEANKVKYSVLKKKCPQHLEISALLKDVADDMEGFFSKPFIWIIKLVMKVKQA